MQACGRRGKNYRPMARVEQCTGQGAWACTAPTVEWEVTKSQDVEKAVTLRETVKCNIGTILRAQTAAAAYGVSRMSYLRLGGLRSFTHIVSCLIRSIELIRRINPAVFRIVPCLRARAVS